MNVAQYDKKMFSSLVEDYYDQSGYFNLGFWADGISTQRGACERLMEELLDFLPYKTGRILDVACGRGATTHHLLSYFAPKDVIGINLSGKQLGDCRTYAPSCDFLQMDAVHLGFREASFDYLISVEAALHFITRERFFYEAFRVLKPGGRLVLSDILMDRWIEMMAPHLSEQNHVHDPTNYQRLMERVGFVDVVVRDTTEYCVAPYYQRIIAYLTEQTRRGRFPKAGLKPVVSQFLTVQQATRFYLLACGTKGCGKPTETTQPAAYGVT